MSGIAADAAATGQAGPAGPAADAVEPAGLPYHRLHRLGARGGWRPVVGIVVVLALLLVVVQLLLVVAFAIGFAIAGRDVEQSVTDLVDTARVTPMTLAFVNLGLAAAIPSTWLVQRVLHGLRPRWLSSVRPRLRWGFLFASFGLAFVTLIVTVIVAAIVPSGEVAGTGATPELNDFTRETAQFLAVILLLTPLQAAGEEYAFRGYLMQALGGTRLPTWVVVVVPALLFGLAHGFGQGLAIFTDRTAFGLVAGILVVRSGGLEAGIAMHVLNNFLAFGAALAFGDMTEALNATGGSWWQLPVTLTQSLVYLALVEVYVRWRRLDRVAAGTPAGTPAARRAEAATADADPAAMPSVGPWQPAVAPAAPRPVEGQTTPYVPGSTWGGPPRPAPAPASGPGWAPQPPPGAPWGLTRLSVSLRTDPAAEHEVEELDAVPADGPDGAPAWRLLSVPVFARHLGRGDVLTTTQVPGDPRRWITRTLTPSGHGAARVRPPEGPLGAAGVLDEVLDRAGRAGCAAYVTTYGVVAVDLPPGAASRDLLAWLEDGSRTGRWRLDLGRRPS